MGGAKAWTMGTGDVGLCRNLGERAGVREEAIAPLSPRGGGGSPLWSRKGARKVMGSGDLVGAGKAQIYVSGRCPWGAVDIDDSPRGCLEASDSHLLMLV